MVSLVRSEHDLVVVIDFGAQYSQLIARRVRECNVYCELWPYTRPLDELIKARPKAVILSGGPASVYGADAPQYDVGLFETDIPVLGICYGMQWMARALGGEVRPAERREYGRTTLEVLKPGGIFQGLAPDEQETGLPCWMSHGDHVVSPPDGFVTIARSDNSPVTAMCHTTKPYFAVQFHPEVEHTPWGRRMLKNFLVEVAGCRQTWTTGSFIDDEVARIRARVGEGRAVCALSGGVDSSVAAAIAYQAIGERLSCVFVDHGLLRKGESDQVARTFANRFGEQFRHIDATERFLGLLAGVADPEEKRKRIGTAFIRVFEEEAAKLGDVDFLVQGTLYPDVIESGFGVASVIKSHHNVGGLPQEMGLQLVEPLRWLFKDEVRHVGEALGLPKEIVWRQPFPGPGLAIRIMGPVTPEKLDIERACDAIVVDEVRRAGLDDEVWQCFAVLTGTRSVGVMGDARTYGHVVAVRAVTSSDGMTADWARLPGDVLERIAARMMNEVPQVGRVVYDISSKPPATIEWE